ncbi:uncharacterized protein LOC131428652 [Malaya genurostris]|uniref:uncharacterized protein LOC131428652 n=1 Tax=Malaya genurostris TaxID=325434 RepID=UPI0026F3B7B7|nr:uncharacterized protein LOC131428652 [Malaya genurostris]
MKVFIVLALCVASALAGLEEDLWLEKNSVRPSGLESFKEPRYTGRIVGGNEVAISSFPYQLSLRSNGNHICGASIISSNWALSAAHCTHPTPAVSTITFRGGSANRNSGGTIFQAAQIVNHGSYNPNTIDNDVCVIRITTSFTGTNISPITIVPSGTGIAAGTRSIVSGWGLTTPGGSLPVNLRAVDIPVVAQSTCQSQWGSGRITANMVCAGEPGRDSCNGDSGGPLVTGGRQFGIVSWGATQCGGNLAGVYANIGASSIRNFISSNTGVYASYISHDSWWHWPLRLFLRSRESRAMKVSIFVFVVFAVTAVCADWADDAWQAHQLIPMAARIFALKHSKRMIGLEKIIGGHKVDVKNFPYQLSLRSNGNHVCGGSVISRSWALTAAHCLYPGRDVTTISLRAGSSGRLAGGQIYNVTRIVIHPQYDPTLFNNDVAVLKVSTPFSGQHVAPVLLAQEGYNPAEGIRGVVSGWGRTLTDDSLPTVLYAVEIPIVGKSVCSRSWGESLLTDNMICAGQLGRDSCNGDSGGPLVSGGRQIGVVSWGSTDCGGPLPAVYTHLGRADVRRFIRLVTGV